MSGKRQATSDLNHENWEREDEPEERGTFRTASGEELKNRVIKKARRKIAGVPTSDTADSADAPKKSLFSGFTGFGQKTTSSTTAPSSTTTGASPFSFLSKIPSTATTKLQQSTTAVKTFTFDGSGGEVKAKETTETDAIKCGNESKTPGGFQKSSNYYSKLKGLNQDLSEWIKTHVDKNPLCILTPIFKDYENYLKDIEKDDSSENQATVSEPKTPEVANKAPANTFGSFKFTATSSAAAPATTQISTSTAAKFSFGSSTSVASASPKAATASASMFSGISKPASTEPEKSNGFSFGIKPNGSATTKDPPPAFSFGKSSPNSSTDDKKPTGFSFTPGAAPFSFGNIQPPSAVASSSSAATNAEEDEEDKPPKVEFKQVVEEDSVYSKKCKVFVKKDGNFTDRGVGTLYLKPIEGSEKTQLLVRADTNLGNILVNLILSAAIPIQRMGKNNVMMVCMPMPDMEKAAPMLLRVKTAEEADELCNTLEKYQK